MELFSEVYGCYYSVVAGILEQAKTGMLRTEIESMVQEQAFYESTFHLLPRLFGGEWSLLEQQADRKYYSKTGSDRVRRPLTVLEKSWLQALLLDVRMGLFLEQTQMDALKQELGDIEPLFYPEDLHVFDHASDGDSYEAESYQENFRIILNACQNEHPLTIAYESGRQKRQTYHVLPYRLFYSNRDDKFRLSCALIQKGYPYRRMVLNLGRIRKAEPEERVLSENWQEQLKYIMERPARSEPVQFIIYNERNALERCLLQFASWEKQTEYDEAKGQYHCTLYYDKQDEPELLIRFLSFGPALQVLEPAGFLKNMKERIARQWMLNNRMD